MCISDALNSGPNWQKNIYFFKSTHDHLVQGSQTFFSQEATKLNSEGCEAAILKERNSSLTNFFFFLNSQGNYQFINETTDVCNYKKKKKKKKSHQTSNYLTVVITVIGRLHFGEPLFINVCNAKYVHHLLRVGDKIQESFWRKHMVLIEIKDVASKQLGVKIFWILKINEFHLLL